MAAVYGWGVKNVQKFTALFVLSVATIASHSGESRAAEEIGKTQEAQIGQVRPNVAQAHPRYRNENIRQKVRSDSDGRVKQAPATSLAAPTKKAEGGAQSSQVTPGDSSIVCGLEADFNQTKGSTDRYGDRKKADCASRSNGVLLMGKGGLFTPEVQRGQRTGLDQRDTATAMMGVGLYEPGTRRPAWEVMAFAGSANGAITRAWDDLVTNLHKMEGQGKPRMSAPTTGRMRGVVGAAGRLDGSLPLACSDFGCLDATGTVFGVASNIEVRTGAAAFLVLTGTPGSFRPDVDGMPSVPVNDWALYAGGKAQAVPRDLVSDYCGTKLFQASLVAGAQVKIPGTGIGVRGEAEFRMTDEVVRAERRPVGIVRLVVNLAEW